MYIPQIIWGAQKSESLDNMICQHLDVPNIMYLFAFSLLHDRVRWKS